MTRNLGRHIEARLEHIDGRWTDVVRRARERAGLNITTKTIEHIRRGRTRDPSADTLRAISVGLRWPPDALERWRAGQVDRDNDVRAPLHETDGDDEELRRQVADIRDQLDRLTDEVKRLGPL